MKFSLKLIIGMTGSVTVGCVVDGVAFVIFVVWFTALSFEDVVPHAVKHKNAQHKKTIMRVRLLIIMNPPFVLDN